MVIYQPLVSNCLAVLEKIFIFLDFNKTLRSVGGVRILGQMRVGVHYEGDDNGTGKVVEQRYPKQLFMNNPTSLSSEFIPTQQQVPESKGWSS